MTGSIVRKLAVTFALIPLFMLSPGCSESTQIELKKEPLVQIPEPKDPEAQPKSLRPGKGSSAGINFDPTGVTPKGGGGGGAPAGK